MSTAREPDWVSVEDYLAAEEASDIRHEYVGGLVYAMAGASPRHNLIALNIASALRAHLRGRPCEVFISDVKVQLEHARNDIFYYPDVMVACDPREKDQLFKRLPKVLVEVMSDSTERLDRREKFWAYMSIPSLEEYILVAQDRLEVTVFRRANEWKAELRTKLDETLDLRSLDFALPLSGVYEGVKV